MLLLVESVYNLCVWPKIPMSGGEDVKIGEHCFSPYHG